MEVNEPAIAYSRQKYSIEEYLELENAATEKHEYYKGEIFAMSGAKIQHNIVTANIFVALANKLDGKPCQPYNSETRIHIEKNTLFTYPDITVICDDPETRNDDDMNVLNPKIIFEVLSPSTRNYNKGQKFELYKDIPTLKEYVLIEPEQIDIQSWLLNSNGAWQLKEYDNIADELLSSSIGISIPIKDVYKRTKLISALS